MTADTVWGIWHVSELEESESWIISFVIKDDVAAGLWK